MNWRPPPEGKIKINVGASSNSDLRHSSIGLIARDSQGVLRGFYARSIPFCSPLLAKTWAIWYGNIWAHHNGWHNCVLASDSLLTYHYINNPS